MATIDVDINAPTEPVPPVDDAYGRVGPNLWSLVLWIGEVLSIWLMAGALFIGAYWLYVLMLLLERIGG